MCINANALQWAETHSALEANFFFPMAASSYFVWRRDRPHLPWIYQPLIQVPICLKLGRPAHMTTSVPYHVCTTLHTELVLCFDTPTMFSVYNSNSCWVSQKYTVFGFLKKDFKEAHPPYCSYGRPHLANKCPRSLVANSVSTCTQLFPQ